MKRYIGLFLNECCVVVFSGGVRGPHLPTLSVLVTEPGACEHRGDAQL